jgi:hypothetical protein
MSYENGPSEQQISEHPCTNDQGSLGYRTVAKKIRIIRRDWTVFIVVREGDKSAKRKNA